MVHLPGLTIINVLDRERRGVILRTSMDASTATVSWAGELEEIATSDPRFQVEVPLRDVMHR